MEEQLEDKRTLAFPELITEPKIHVLNVCVLLDLICKCRHEHNVECRVNFTQIYAKRIQCLLRKAGHPSAEFHLDFLQIIQDKTRLFRDWWDVRAGRAMGDGHKCTGSLVKRPSLVTLHYRQLTGSRQTLSL